MTHVLNVALGKYRTYVELGAANDALIAVVLEATGLESETTMRDHDDLAALLAGTSNEQTTMGRKTLTTVAGAVDDVDNRYEADSDDIVWLAATGNATGGILICYDSDTTAGTDANIIPLSFHTWARTPDGSDLTATVADFFRSVSA